MGPIHRSVYEVSTSDRNVIDSHAFNLANVRDRNTLISSQC